MAKKRELKKHSAAIHTIGKLSLLERKLSNVLLYNAYDNLLDTRTHQINMVALGELAGYDSNDRNLVKESLRALKRIEIEWDALEEDGSSTWGTSNLLASVEITKGICTYEYSEMLAEKLATPDIFGVISLDIQKKFKSGYALTIYEICSRFKGFLSKRTECYTKWYPIEQFRQFLGVSESSLYDSFKELNRRILKPSVNEINGSLQKYPGTDIHIEAEYKKASRFVTDIRFRITRNKQFQLPLEENVSDETRKMPEYQDLLEFGFADKAAVYVIQTNELEYVREKLAITKAAIKSGSIQHSVSGYMAQAIEKDYQPKKTLASANAKKVKADEEAEVRRQEDEKLRTAISQSIRADYIASLSDEQKEALLKEIRDQLLPSIKKFVKSLTSPQIAVDVNQRIPNFDEKMKKMLDEID